MTISYTFDIRVGTIVAAEESKEHASLPISSS